MRRFLFPLLLAVAACATPEVAVQTPKEPLYFAIEMRQGGHLVGTPRLVGFSGKSIVAERAAPGARHADYHLELHPTAKGPGYQVGFSLDLGQGLRSSQLSLLHGQERTFQLDESTEVRLLLLKVDSPEFRALMGPKPTSTL